MIPYVYEVYLPEVARNELIFTNRDYATEYARYCANYYHEPTTISCRIHGSRKTICKLTIYPDWKEE